MSVPFGGSKAGLSPEQPDRSRLEFANADLRRAGRKLERCGKVTFGFLAARRAKIHVEIGAEQ